MCLCSWLQGQSQTLHWDALRVSVPAAGRGAGELGEELVGGLQWDFSCMEISDSPPCMPGCVSRSLG